MHANANVCMWGEKEGGRDGAIYEVPAEIEDGQEDQRNRDISIKCLLKKISFLRSYMMKNAPNSWVLMAFLNKYCLSISSWGFNSSALIGKTYNEDI